MRLPFVGQAVADISLEYAVAIGIGDRSEFGLRIEGAFELWTGSDEHHEISPGEYDESQAVLESLTGLRVAGATADESGELNLSFSSGARIRVAADEDYEAWTTVGPDGFLVVCTPGGELAVWAAQVSG